MWESVFGVGLGLIVIFLVVSLVVSAVQEIIAAVFRLRAKGLTQGIRSLLKDEALLKSFYEHSLIKGLVPHASKKPSYIPSKWFALAVLDELKLTGQPDSDALKAAVANLDSNAGHNAIAGTVKALAQRADYKFETLQNELAGWFDDAMDRVSGWYARQARWISLAVAVIVVLLMNADAVRIAGAIWQSASLQATLIALSSDSLAMSDAAKALPAGVIEQVLNSVPIGWTCPGAAPVSAVCIAENWSPYRLLGWAITVFAASLGAPFWFDLLGRVARVRASGITPERSPTTPAQPSK